MSLMGALFTLPRIPIPTRRSPLADSNTAAGKLSAARTVILSAILMSAAILSGCGTARIDLKTDVLASGEVAQEITIRGEGLIGEALRESFDLAQARSDGWTAELKGEGDSYVIRMAKRLKQGEDWLPPSKSASPVSDTGSQTQVDFKVSERLFDREYRLRIVMPPGDQSTPSEMDEFDIIGEQFAEQLLQTMFKMTWTINLPGEVVETNADSKTTTGGTWEIGLRRMEDGVEMHLVSRERRNLLPVTAGAVAILALAGIAIYWLRRRATLARLS